MNVLFMLRCITCAVPFFLSRGSLSVRPTRSPQEEVILPMKNLNPEMYLPQLMPILPKVFQQDVYARIKTRKKNAHKGFNAIPYTELHMYCNLSSLDFIRQNL